MASIGNKIIETLCKCNYYDFDEEDNPYPSLTSIIRTQRRQDTIPVIDTPFRQLQDVNVEIRKYIINQKQKNISWITLFLKCVRQNI
jgi:hypothetical protein